MSDHARWQQALAGLPHGPSLRLLDEITAVDATSLTACSTRHHRAAHPLALASGELPASTLVELAAQAAAVHIALGSAVGDTPPRAKAGVLALVRELDLSCASVAAVVPTIWITVRRRATIPSGVAYDFVAAAGETFATATATFALAKGQFGVVVAASTAMSSTRAPREGAA